MEALLAAAAAGSWPAALVVIVLFLVIGVIGLGFFWMLTRI